MLQLNYTYDNLDAISNETYAEFQTLENVVLTIFKILAEYEKLVESSELK